MLFPPKGTLALVAVAHGFRHWIFHLGALGFIPLGLLDSSVVPVPGSMDVLTIVLSARERDLWPYYASMATLGSVIGALVTYRLARKGGQEALEKRVKPQTLRKVQQLFDRWGLRHRHTSRGAAAGSDDSFCTGGKGDAIPGEEIRVCAVAWAGCALHDWPSWQPNTDGTSLRISHSQAMPLRLRLPRSSSSASP